MSPILPKTNADRPDRLANITFRSSGLDVENVNSL
jgi:hypothetical protein